MDSDEYAQALLAHKPFDFMPRKRVQYIVQPLMPSFEAFFKYGCNMKEFRSRVGPPVWSRPTLYYNKARFRTRGHKEVWSFNYEIRPLRPAPQP